MKFRLATRTIFLALLLASGLLPGCAGVRSTVMDIRNDSLTGKQAPELQGGQWLKPMANPAPGDPRRDWRLIAFFLPW